MDEDYDKVKIDLESDLVNIEEQFINFSDRWFFKNQEKSERIRAKIEELKSNF